MALLGKAWKRLSPLKSLSWPTDSSEPVCFLAYGERKEGRERREEGRKDPSMETGKDIHPHTYTRIHFLIPF